MSQNDIIRGVQQLPNPLVGGVVERVTYAADGKIDSVRDDVVVLTLQPPGSITHDGTTSSAWKKKSLAQKYELGGAHDYNVIGLVVYRNAKIEYRYDSGGYVIGHYVRDWSEKIEKQCNNDNVAAVYLTMMVDEKPYMTLASALVLKDVGALTVVEPRCMLSGALTIHRGIRDLELMMAGMNIRPNLIQAGGGLSYDHTSLWVVHGQVKELYTVCERHILASGMVSLKRDYDEFMALVGDQKNMEVEQRATICLRRGRNLLESLIELSLDSSPISGDKEGHFNDFVRLANAISARNVVLKELLTLGLTSKRDVDEHFPVGLFMRFLDMRIVHVLRAVFHQSGVQIEPSLLAAMLTWREDVAFAITELDSLVELSREGRAKYANGGNHSEIGANDIQARRGEYIPNASGRNILARGMLADDDYEKLLRTIDNVDQAAIGFQEFVSVVGTDLVGGEVKMAVDGFNEVIAGLKATGENIDRVTVHLAEKMQSYSKISGWGSMIFDVIGIIVDCCDGSYDMSFASFSKVVMRLMSAFKITGAVIGTLSTYLQEKWNDWRGSESSQVRMGSRGEAGRDVGPLPLITAVIGTIACSRLPTKTELQRVNDLTRAFNSFVPAAGHMSELMSWFVGLLPECVQAWMRTLDPSYDAYVDLLGSKFVTWMNRVHEVCTSENAQILANAPEIRKTILDLEEEGHDMLVEVARKFKGPECGKMSVLINSTYKNVQKFADLARGIKSGAEQRITPFSVYITGKPNIGKSTALLAIAKLLAPEGTEKGNLMYTRKAANQFWDGYRGQFALVYDDFFQNVDVKDAVEVADIVSPASFIPNYASLDDFTVGVKGTPFTSKLILFSSNVAYPKNSGYRTEEALWRRRNLLFEFALLPTCYKANGKEPDYSKFKDDMSHLMIKQLDPLVENGPGGNYLSWEDFLRVVRTGYVNHYAREEKVSTNTGKVDEMIARVRQEITIPSTSRAEGWGDWLGLRNPSKDFAMDMRYKIEERKKEKANVVASYSKAAKDTGKSVFEIAIEREQEPTVTFSEKHSAVIEETKKSLKQKHDEYILENPKLGLLIRLGEVAAVIGIPLFLAFKAYRSYSKSGEKKIVENVIENAFENVAQEKMTPGLLSCAVRLEGMKKKADRGFVNKCINYMKALIKNKQICAEEYDDFIETFETSNNIEMFGILKESGISGVGLNCAFTAGDEVFRRLNLDPRVVKMLLNLRVITAGLPEDEADAMHKLWKRAYRDTVLAPYWAFLEKWNAMEDFDLEDAVVRWKNENQQIESRDDRDIRKRREINEKVKYRAHGNISEGCEDPNAWEMINTNILPNMVVVKVKDRETDRVFSTRGFFIVGNRLLAPAHVFMTASGKWVPEKSSVILKSLTRPLVVVPFLRENLVQLKDSAGALKDVVIFNTGPRCMQYPTILNHIIPEKRLSILERFSGNIPTLTVRKTLPADENGVSDMEIMPLVYNVRAVRLTHPEGYGIGSDQDDKQFVLFDGYRYSASTEPGMCGSPLVLNNPRIAEKIIAIHVCASKDGSDGKSETITREQVDAALDKLSGGIHQNLVQGAPVHAEASAHFESAMALPESDGLTMVGVVPRSEVVRAPERTTIVPSVIQGRVYPVLTAPAVLSPRDPRLGEEFKGLSPIANTTKKFGDNSVRTKFLDPDRLKAATQGALEHILHTWKRIVPFKRVLTLDEGINGRVDVEHMTGLNEETSAGLPMSTWPERKSGGGGKRFLFEGEPRNRRIKIPRFGERVAERIAKAKKGERVVSEWNVFPKDERRSFAKILKGETRGVVPSPADFTIVCRMYTLCFVANMYANYNNGESAVGMDTCSMDWTTMVDYLLENSDLILCGDFKAWDTTVAAEVIDAVRQIVDAWYAYGNDEDLSEDNLVRATLFNEMIHTNLRALDVSCFKHSGNPSGNPLTVVVNTVGLMVLFRYVYLELAPVAYRNMVCYDKNVRLKSYGDDHLASYKAAIKEWFNIVTVAEAFNRIGMGYTAPDKESSLYEMLHINIEDPRVTFLKCAFRKVNSKLWAPIMAAQTRTELTNWIRECETPLEQCVENCAMALRMTFFLGPQAFNEMRDLINRAFHDVAETRREKWERTLPTYEEFNLYFGDKHGLPVFAYYNADGTQEIRLKKTYIGRNEVQGSLEKAAPEMTPDEVTKEGSGGVTLIRQTPPEIVSPEGGVDRNKLVDKIIPKENWDYQRMVERNVFIGSYAWKTVDGPMTIIKSWAVPNDLVTATVSHLPFKTFGAFRGKTVLNINMTGSKFFTGRLLCVFIPMCRVDTLQYWHLHSLPALSTLQGAWLDPAENSVVKFVINPINPRAMIDIRSPQPFDFYGTVALVVANQLQTGTDSPTQTVNVSVFVSFEDATFKTLLPLTSSGIQGLGNNVIQGNTLVNNYKHVQKVVVGDTKQTGAEIGTGATVALDKPTVGASPFPTQVTSAFGYLSHGTNLEYIERLALDPGAISLPSAETFQCSKDEMDIKYLLTMQQWEATIPWTAAHGVGTVLASGNICVMPLALADQLIIGNTFAPVMSDAIACKFSFWSGGIIFKFQIIASVYHTGELVFCTNIGTNVDTTDLSIAMSQYNAPLSLGEGIHEFTFKVPYQSKFAALRVPNGPETTLTEYLRHSMGRWSLRVVNVLQAPAGVSQSVDVNQWRYMAEDAQVHGLGANNISLVPVFEALVGGNVIQGDEGHVETVVAPVDGNNNNNVFREKITNIGTIIKRYFRAGAWALNIDAFGSVLTRNYNIGLMLFRPNTSPFFPHPAEGEYVAKCGLFSYFSAFYRGYRGSVRFKVVFSPTNTTLSNIRSIVAYTPDAPTDGAVPFSALSDAKEYNSMLTLYGFLDGTSSIPQEYIQNGLPMNISDTTCQRNVVEIPFTSQFDFLLIGKNSNEYQLSTNDIYTPGALMHRMTPGNISGRLEAAVEVEYLAAAGDEFMFGLLLGPPRLYVAGGLFPDTYLPL